MNKLNHVAFIMDGNGRWGQKRKKGRNFGHLSGVKRVKEIVECSVKLKIPTVTFYVFSTENWKRPKSEINFLFKLIINYFNKELNNIISNGIKLNIIGKIDKLPIKLRFPLRRAVKDTEKNKKIVVNLAINYGSKDEIIYAVKKIKKEVSINTLEKNLFTKNSPDPDILIRTGGHKRLSNFMLWQLAYAEIYFLDKLWPDFNSTDLKKIIQNFKKIKRNYGAV
jgi:undecaprenyl diphosphate synthase